MKKSDIKNGMHLITDSGDEYIVVGDVYAPKQDTQSKTVLVSLSHGWMSLEDYDDNLRCCDDDGSYVDYGSFDVKEVYAPKFYKDMFDSVKYNKDEFIKLWERHIAKKMTKAEIEEELGYEIEIVED
jgi:hypothetical protein